MFIIKLIKSVYLGSKVITLSDFKCTIIVRFVNAKFIFAQTPKMYISLRH
jgi:hypothetical protein